MATKTNAYSKSATIAQIKKELAAIKKRGKKGATKQAVVSTYRRNLERRAKKGIAQRGKTWHGFQPASRSDVNKTFGRHAKAGVTRATNRARRIWVESQHPRGRGGKFTRK